MTASLARPAVRRTPRSSGLIGQLNTEWRAVAATPLPRSWQAHRALAGHLTVGDVLDRVSTMTQPREADPILHALLTAHAEGAPLAGRAVLQTMLGKVVRLSYTARRRGRTDPLETALAAMWTAIASFPLHRTGGVAGNLSCAALALLPPAEPPTTALTRDPADGGPTDPSVDRAGPMDAGAVIRWALEQHVLGTAEAVLLAAVYVRPDGQPVTLKTAAAELGISHAAARQRHARAVRTLASGVLDRLCPDGASGARLTSSPHGGGTPRLETASPADQLAAGAGHASGTVVTRRPRVTLGMGPEEGRR